MMTLKHVFKELASFFKDDYEKTLLWFYVKNPALGGVKPIEMIKNGRTDKLCKFIETALEGNFP